MYEEGKLSVEIGKRIFERRKQIGITQERLAEIADTTPQAISNYERGERELKAGVIIKIAEGLNVTTDYLLTGNSNSLFSQSKADGISDNDLQTINDIIEKCFNLAKNEKEND